MIKHYIKIALRNLSKQKGLAFINVFGLSVGLACFSLFLLYAVNEFSFDRFHKNASNVYRVYRWTAAINGQEARGDSYMPIPLGPAMKQDLPDVVNYVRMRDGWGESFIKADDKVTRLPVLYADPQMFSVLSFKFLSGNPATALQNQRNIVLSNKTAVQLFGKTDVIGKTVEIKADTSFEPFTVSAVAEDAPVNSTIQFSIVGSWAFMESLEHNKAQLVNWHRSGYQTYVQLKQGSNLANEKSKLAVFRKKYYPEEEAEWRKEREWKAAGTPVSYGLQPIKQMHTDTKIGGGSVEAVSPKNIWILLLIAAAVLLIACINFTIFISCLGLYGLVSFMAAQRTKEVGIRKVLGATPAHIVYLLSKEFSLLIIIAFVIASPIAYYIMHKWLENYTYRIPLSASIFIMAIVGSMIIAWLTVGYRAIKAALANPVKNLRTE